MSGADAWLADRMAYKHTWRNKNVQALARALHSACDEEPCDRCLREAAITLATIERYRGTDAASLDVLGI